MMTEILGGKDFTRIHEVENRCASFHPETDQKTVGRELF